jgi:hypothetical protein
VFFFDQIAFKGPRRAAHMRLISRPASRD